MANTNLLTTIALVLKINVADYVANVYDKQNIFFKRGRDDMTVDNEGVTSFD